MSSQSGNVETFGFWADAAGRLDMCSMLGSSEVLSATQSLSLSIGCSVGVSQPVAVLGGLTAALIGVVTLAAVLVWSGEKVAQLMNRQRGTGREFQRLNRW